MEQIKGQLDLFDTIDKLDSYNKNKLVISYITDPGNLCEIVKVSVRVPFNEVTTQYLEKYFTPGVIDIIQKERKNLNETNNKN